MNTRETGKSGEDAASAYLLRRGYRIICRNWADRFGEIDLVTISPENRLVFVEVKLLRSKKVGLAEDKITPAKLERIRRTAERYVKEKHHAPSPERIDVITISAGKITHYKNVFFRKNRIMLAK
ncbi:YraN family protein [Chitinivibrio alkaliphilus]|uniref:UPF0102 protein CALK_0482 n=1 Tax=Chitinivibrio alkaliphilus ACht1 TaxID=1313304 RepID=U7DAD5_9BACT|nr:YraN family protein [Chitinivibrio alkaliphilus]ERP38992.1 hypothetical protein CALK_0482 [Chitinivibrio alkaliphilus ACht1]